MSHHSLLFLRIGHVPALFGFGLFPGDGMLVDLSGTLPAWSMAVVQLLAVAFFGCWLLLRKKQRAVEWAVRSPFAVRRKNS